MNINTYNEIWLNELAKNNLKLANDYDNRFNTTKQALSFGDYKMRGGVRDRDYPMVGTDEQTYAPSSNAVSSLIGYNTTVKKAKAKVKPEPVIEPVAEPEPEAVVGGAKGSVELEKAKESLKKFVNGERKSKPSKKHIELLEAKGVISKKVEGGKVNRLKKGEKWRDFVVDTVDKGLDLGAKGKMIAGKVNRLKKAKAWTNFSVDTIDKGLNLASKGKMIAGAKKAPSKWVQFLKDYSKKHNITYKEAMIKGKAEYKK